MLRTPRCGPDENYPGPLHSLPGPCHARSSSLPSLPETLYNPFSTLLFPGTRSRKRETLWPSSPPVFSSKTSPSMKPAAWAAGPGSTRSLYRALQGRAQMTARGRSTPTRHPRLTPRLGRAKASGTGGARLAGTRGPARRAAPSPPGPDGAAGRPARGGGDGSGPAPARGSQAPHAVHWHAHASAGCHRAPQGASGPCPTRAVRPRPQPEPEDLGGPLTGEG